MSKRLIIDGRYQVKDGQKPRRDARRLIIVDGRKKWLQQRVFDTLAKLAEGRRYLWRGVVGHTMLAEDPREHLGMVITRVRKQSGLTVTPHFPCSYRLGVPSRDIELLDGPSRIGRQQILVV